MRLAILLVTLGLALPALADTPKPSGRLKAYKGPEGEIIVMVPANDDKQMLVYFKDLGGELEGKTLLYELEDRGDRGKTVYTTKKQGSKTYRSVLLDGNGGRWDFFHPANFKVHFSIVYSEAATEKIKLDEVMKAYQP
jgi:hypothetical protein